MEAAELRPRQEEVLIGSRISRIHPSEAGVVQKAPATSGLDIADLRIVDSTGIPLSSDREPELAVGVDFRYKPFPYASSPSRYPGGCPHEKPISGLEKTRLAQNYPAMLSILHMVRSSYLQPTYDSDAPTEDRPLSSGEAKQLLRGLTFLPHYLALRGENAFPAQGSLPPAVIALSNSANGSLGALGGYLNAHAQERDIDRRTPDVGEMLCLAEASGHMVGEKTVCVASPDQMRHFLDAVINGVSQAAPRFDTSTFLEPEEIAPLIRFAQQAEDVSDIVGVLLSLDRKCANKIRKHVKNGHNKRRIRGDVEDFREQTQPYINGFALTESLVNLSLNRAHPTQKVTLETFERVGLEMPSLLRRANL